MLHLLYVSLDLLPLRTTVDWRNKVYVTDFFLGSGVCLLQAVMIWTKTEFLSGQITICYLNVPAACLGRFY